LDDEAKFSNYDEITLAAFGGRSLSYEGKNSQAPLPCVPRKNPPFNGGLPSKVLSVERFERPRSCNFDVV